MNDQIQTECKQNFFMGTGQACLSASSGKLKKKNLKDKQNKPRLMSG